MRDAVEAREFNEGAEDFVDAVEGRVDLADVLPGILGSDWMSLPRNDGIRLACSFDWLDGRFGA
jgi:hypothetical protein